MTGTAIARSAQKRRRVSHNGLAVPGRSNAVPEERDQQAADLSAEIRLGMALRRAREERGFTLRALARRLYRSHSTLVEYERGHRLAPLDVIEAYETELGLSSGSLVGLHERARLELYGADRSRRQTYVLKPVLNMPHQLPS